MGDSQTPQEHFKRGLFQLELAEQAVLDNPAGATVLAAMAHARFTAASAGAAVAALEAMTHPQQIVIPDELAAARDEVQRLRSELEQAGAEKVGREELRAKTNRVVTVLNRWQRWREAADEGAPFAELYDQVLKAIDEQGS